MARWTSRGRSRLTAAGGDRQGEADEDGSEDPFRGHDWVNLRVGAGLGNARASGDAGRDATSSSVACLDARTSRPVPGHCSDIAGRPVFSGRRRRSSGPTGWPAPRRSARSISAVVATPSRTAQLGLGRHRVEDPAAIASADAEAATDSIGERRGDVAASPVLVAVEPEPVLRPSWPASTSRAWIGDGRSRSGRPRPSQMLVAAARLTSSPGEVHQLERTHRDSRPRAARRRSPRRRLAGLEQPERLDRERAVDPVDDEARACPCSGPGSCPRPSPRRRPARRRRGAVAAVATTSTRAMSGTGLKQWRPRTRSGRVVALGDRGDRQRARVRGEDDVGSASASRARKIARLSSRSSSAASMTRSASVASLDEGRGAWRSRRAAPSTQSSIESVGRRRVAPNGGGASGRRGSRSRRAIDGGRVDVVEHDLAIAPRARPGRSPAPIVPAPTMPTMAMPDRYPARIARLGHTVLSASNGWRHARQ